MNEIIDDITLCWGLREALAKRHHFMRTSDDKLFKLEERGWIEMGDGDVVITEAGLAAPHKDRDDALAEPNG